MGFLVGVLRTAYKTGKIAADTVESGVRKAKKSKVFIEAAKKQEQQLAQMERKYRGRLTDEQRDNLANAREQARMNIETAECWRENELIREAYEMTAKQLAKAINHSSGEVRRIYLSVAKKRRDVEYRPDKGKYKAVKY